METIQSFLQRITMFSEVPKEALDVLAGKFIERHFDHGDLVLQEGEAGDSLFLVMQGRAEAFHLVDGKRLFLSYMNPPDFFGEIGMLTGGIRTASVQANGPLRVLELPRKAFFELLANEQSIRELMMEAVQERGARSKVEINQQKNTSAITYLLKKIARLEAGEGHSPESVTEQMWEFFEKESKS